VGVRSAHGDCGHHSVEGVMLGPTGIVVKNTFLEVGENDSLMDSLGWRRQTSEPVSVYTRRTPTEDDDSELDCDDFLLGSPDPHPGGPGPPDLSALPEVEDHTSSPASNSKPPKVLLLSESIPFREVAEQEQEARKNHKENYSNRDNNLKDVDITKKEPPWTDVTTVMMRNLPNKYTQQMLLEELQDGGFRLQNDIDFFYLPMDHSNAANLGYCFINFVETALANAFASSFQGKKMRRFNSSKTVVVMPASIQGYDRNYAYYASTRVAQAEDPQYRPLFLRSPPPNSQWSGGQGGGGVPKGAGGGKGRGSSKNNANGGKSGKGRGKDRGKMDSMDAFSGPDMGGYMDWHQQVPQVGVAGAAPWPGMHQMGAPGQAMNPRPSGPPMSQEMAVCGNCGKECGRTHRFCAFCGSSIGQDAGKGGMMGMAGNMRADAPSFVPAFGPGGPQSGPPSMQVQQIVRNRPDPNMFRSNDSVTDELDVMRGRMMLLAALKDMEKREGRDDQLPSEYDLPAGLSAALGGLNMEAMGGNPLRGVPSGPPDAGQRPVEW